MERTKQTGAGPAATQPAPNAGALQVGDAAPDFIASSTHGELELRQVVKQGPVVLAFYPADFTPG
jgi:peroxiredoxin